MPQRAIRHHCGRCGSSHHHLPRANLLLPLPGGTTPALWLLPCIHTHTNTGPLCENVECGGTGMLTGISRGPEKSGQHLFVSCGCLKENCVSEWCVGHLWNYGVCVVMIWFRPGSFVVWGCNSLFIFGFNILFPLSAAQNESYYLYSTISCS